MNNFLLQPFILFFFGGGATAQDAVQFQGQCGLARPRELAGGNPAWVIVRREPSIEPCGVDGNGHVDA